MSYRWTAPRPKKQTKYRNDPCEYNGIRFPSKKEMNRFRQLSLLERAGEISDLKLQVPFELQPSFKHNGKTIRAIKYVADFTYLDKDGKIHIEDTKGFRTREYELKKKMMLYKGWEIEEK